MKLIFKMVMMAAVMIIAGLAAAGAGIVKRVAGAGGGAGIIGICIAGAAGITAIAIIAVITVIAVIAAGVCAGIAAAGI